MRLSPAPGFSTCCSFCGLTLPSLSPAPVLCAQWVLCTSMCYDLVWFGPPQLWLLWAWTSALACSRKALWILPSDLPHPSSPNYLQVHWPGMWKSQEIILYMLNKPSVIPIPTCPQSPGLQQCTAFLVCTLLVLTHSGMVGALFPSPISLNN